MTIDATVRAFYERSGEDARQLQFADASVDIVLLLGPLYHLTDEAERRTALKEALRVLRPGGQLIAAAVSRWATMLYGLTHDLFVEPAFQTLAWEGARTGVNVNPAQVRGGFTTAYFHRPEELRYEISTAGFVVDELVGVEGPACLLRDFEEQWQVERTRNNIVDIAGVLEAEPALLGMSAHLLALARKP